MNRNGGRSTRGDGRCRDEDLLRRVEPLVQSVAVRFARDRTTAEELAQACRIRIHEKRRQCRDPDALLGWAKTLCRRVCADAVGRDRIERDRLVETGGEVNQAVDAAPDPLAATETAELRVRIGSALARLPAEQRRLLLLRHWYGLSANEIARRENLPGFHREKPAEARLPAAEAHARARLLRAASAVAVVARAGQRYDKRIEHRHSSRAWRGSAMIPGLYFEEILIHKLLARPSDFRAVFRASPDAMLLVGADGLLRDANREAETMFGWSREELVGESVEILVPPGLRDRHRRHREAYHRKPSSRPMGVGMELQAVHKDGGGFPVEISLGPMTDETGEVLVVCAVRSLAQSQMLRRVAAARVLAAEAERSRIARDLHDEVKQSLTAVQLHLAALVERGMAGEDAPKMISGVQGDLDRCHDALDRAIRDLMPVELEGHGLEFALSVLCRRTEEQGFAVERDIRWAGRALRAETSLAVFRVVQEALNNAKRHSGAGSAKLRYWREGRTLYAEVSDSGAGFSPDELEPHLSVGLGSMRERSRIAGGRLTVASALGEGTSVRLEVPIGMPAREEDDPE